MTKQAKSAVLNTVAATAGNLKEDATAKLNTLCVLNTADPLVPIGLPPIPYGAFVETDVVYAQDEFTQLAVIGTTDETIVSNRRYKIELGARTDKYESSYQYVGTYAYTAGVLSGTAATDRNVVYSALVDKVNAQAGNNVTAYTLHKFAYTGGTTSTGTVGTTAASPLAAVTTANKVIAGSPGTQGTSLVTMNIAAITVASGSLAGADAAGYVWAYNLSDASSLTTNDITFTDAVNSEDIVITPTTTGTAGQGMVIVDDAGYYQSLKRGGESSVFLSEGFLTATTVTIARTPLESLGEGAVMLANKINYTYTGEDVDPDVLDEDFDFATDPASGTWYAKVTIICKKDIDKQAIGYANAEQEVRYVLWVAQTSVTSVGTNAAALIAAINGIS